ncbi:MAG: hypothetical protein OXF79_10790 [Chloroflexi bacterium]|nr:hypothetical protein [Chloroflexota bacterium]
MLQQSQPNSDTTTGPTWRDWFPYVAAAPVVLTIIHTVVWIWICYQPTHPVTWNLFLIVNIGAAIPAALYLAATIEVLRTVSYALLRSRRRTATPPYISAHAPVRPPPGL